MNEVRIYKPLRKIAESLGWEGVGEWGDPDRLVLVRIISPKELIEKVEEDLNKIKNTKDRVFSAWRNIAKRPPVKCLYCGKVTENLNDNGRKEFCSNICGTNYRYQINKINLEEKSEEARQSGQGKIQIAE